MDRSALRTTKYPIRKREHSDSFPAKEKSHNSWFDWGQKDSPNLHHPKRKLQARDPFFFNDLGCFGIVIPPLLLFYPFFYKIFFFLSRYGRMGDKKEIVIHVCLTFFPFRRFSRHGAIPGPPSHTWLG